MREAWGRWACVAIGASCPLAPAAFASDGASDGGGDGAGRFVATIVPAPAPATWARGPIVPPAPVPPPSDPDPRSRAVRLATLGIRTAVRDPYAGVARRISVRGTGTLDLYSGQNRGFRLSAAPRYRMQYAAPEDGPGARSGAIATMRLPGGALSLRDGYERLAPVAAAGYDTFVADRLKVGVEGGMMLGRAAGIYALSGVPHAAQESRTAANPVADVTMTYLF